MAYEDLKERIEELELELRNTKVNKRTEMAVGLLKAKIAKLKEELESKLSRGKTRGEGFAVKKEGDATIGLLGKPSVGKSTFFKAATLAEVEIASYPFTTIKANHGVGYVRLECIDKEFNRFRSLLFIQIFLLISFTLISNLQSKGNAFSIKSKYFLVPFGP